MCLFSDSWSVSSSLFQTILLLIVPVGEFHHAVLTIRVLWPKYSAVSLDVSWVDVFRKIFHARSFMDRTKDVSDVEST